VVADAHSTAELTDPQQTVPWLCAHAQHSTALEQTLDKRPGIASTLAKS